MTSFRDQAYADYLDYTKSASITCRHLAFAGIALIWVFRVEGSALGLPSELIAPALWIVAALAFDLLQYVAGSLLWGLFVWLHDGWVAKGRKEPANAPHWINWPMRAFFWAKLVSVFVGYLLISCFLADRIGVVAPIN